MWVVSKLRLVAVVTALSAVSCVLFVSNETYGDRCKFAGEATACGRCLRLRCQPQVDACCGDDACSSALSAVDACAQRMDGACNDLTARKDRAGPEGALASCVAQRCGAVCHAFAGTSDTKCGEPAFGGGTTCECTSAPGSGNDFECSSESYVSTICCAPESWPAPGVGCTCRPTSCYTTPEGCSCRLVDTPPEHARCEAPPCCVSDLHPEQCSCRESCFGNERSVPSCSSTASGRAIGCNKGQKLVDTCSIRSL